MATLNDIAKRLGISKGTVSKALNQAPDVSETLRKTVLETAIEMGYTQKRLKKDESKKLCIFIENMNFESPNHFGYDLVMGFKKMAEPEGYTVDLLPITADFQKKTSYDIFMLENGYLGAFILGFTLNDPWMVDFETTCMPTVLYDNYIKDNPHTAYVGVDNPEGFDMAISYLKSQGHQKIGYLSGALGSQINRHRYKAFFSAMSRNHLKADQTLVACTYHVSDCTGTYLPKILEKGVTAILCSHDTLAQAVMVACQERGLSIPTDISIIGFDDIPLCAYTNPPLTTIRQDRPELGKCGYYALNSLMNQVNISTLLLHARLILRDSSGPVPQ